MELTQAMRTAAAIRRFRPDPVADETLYRVLEPARFAPSGGNRQGWHVIVVRDQALRTRLKELYLQSWGPLYQAQLAQGGGPDAARAEGLGATLTMLLLNHEPEVRQVLAVPEGYALVAHIGIGWPAQPHPTRLRRRPVEDFTSIDRFGGAPLSPSVISGR